MDIFSETLNRSRSAPLHCRTGRVGVFVGVQLDDISAVDLLAWHVAGHSGDVSSLKGHRSGLYCVQQNREE